MLLQTATSVYRKRMSKQHSESEPATTSSPQREHRYNGGRTDSGRSARIVQKERILPFRSTSLPTSLPLTLPPLCAQCPRSDYRVIKIIRVIQFGMYRPRLSTILLLSKQCFVFLPHEKYHSTGIHISISIYVYIYTDAGISNTRRHIDIYIYKSVVY